MSQSVNGLSNSTPITFDAIIQELSTQISKTGNTVPGLNETLSKFKLKGNDTTQPELSPPTTTDTSKAGAMLVGGLSLGGLSLETMMDAVGMEQRRTESKAGMANIEARAQERADANAEKLKQVQEELDKAKNQGFLDGLIKAFKYIGMAIATIGSIAMIVAGAVGLAAGGSGTVLIAIGVASFFLLVDSITQEATDGKVGFGPGFIAGKIASACAASESATRWIQFGFDLATTIALAVAGGVAAGKFASTTIDAASKVATATQKFSQVAGMTAKVGAIAGGVNTIAQSATTIAGAVNQLDIENLKASQKRLQAILERISVANDLDLEHLKTMMQRSEETLQTVSDIVQEGVQTNVSIMTGSPSMA